MTHKKSIGIDIGGTKICGALIVEGGNILKSVKVDTPQGEASDTAHVVSGVIKEIISNDVVGIGLGVPGWVDHEKGTIYNTPNLSLSGFDLRGAIHDKFNLPVFIDNDANLAVLAEHSFGMAKDYKNVIGLTVGTGIGGGIILNGKVYRGVTGTGAEIGHMVVQPNGPKCGCGSSGCLDVMASGTGLIRAAKERINKGKESQILKLANGNIENIQGPMITKAAENGDKLAKECFDEVGFWLGIGINNLINICNPEMIILGGGVAGTGDLIMDPVRKVILERTKDVCKIVISKLGNEAGMLGAGALVFESSKVSHNN